MEVIRHLSNEELVDLQIASDEQALGASLGPFRDAARQRSERPEIFWHQQRAQIREQVDRGENRGRSWIPLIWAVAILLVGASIAIFGAGSAAVPTVQTRPAASADADQQLLIAVQQAVEQGVPDSLEPAAYLAEQIGQGARPLTSKDGNKEATSEN